jgi:hypothetical protein
MTALWIGLAVGVVAWIVVGVADVLRGRQRKAATRVHRELGLIVDLQWVRAHQTEFEVVEWWGDGIRRELWLLRGAKVADREAAEGEAFRVDPAFEGQAEQTLREAGREIQETVSMRSLPPSAAAGAGRRDH